MKIISTNINVESDFDTDSAQLVRLLALGADPSRMSRID